MPLAKGRLLVLSTFAEKQRRVTAALAASSNEFVAALTSAVFIAYAEQNGKTESFASSILEGGKPVLTFDSPDNANLVGMGAKAISSESIQEFVRQGSFLQ